MTVLKKPGDLIAVPCGVGAKAVVYRWRFPTGYEAIQVASTLAELGARERSPLVIYHQMLACLALVFNDPHDEDGVAFRRQVEGQIDLLREMAAADPGDARNAAYEAWLAGDTALGDLADMLTQARSVPECVKLAKLRADFRVYHAKLGLAVATHLLADITPHPAARPKPRRGLPPPQGLVDAITDTEHLAALGWSYQFAIKPTETEAKNSVSPSPGSGLPDSSVTASTPT